MTVDLKFFALSSDWLARVSSVSMILRSTRSATLLILLTKESMFFVSDIFLISWPFTLPPPLGVPGFTCLFISMEKLFVILPKVSSEALFVASLIDKLIRLRLDMANITRKIISDFNLFLVTYAKAFLSIVPPPIQPYRLA